MAPYGYRLEKRGRMNKKHHEVYEIVVDEDEAAVVKTIFEKYVNEGFGAQRLNRWLYEQGVRTRRGSNFTNTTIIKMLKNIAYVGILRSGGSQSEAFPELQIIPPELFERAQQIMEGRTQKHRDVPFNSKGKALLSGLVYCGHCGSKLVLTTCGGPRRNGKRETRLRYTCHNKIRHPQDCDGQTGYSVEKLDGIVEKLIVALFKSIHPISEQELVAQQMERQQKEQRAALARLREQQARKEKELESYKSEVRKAIRGESTWDKELLNELVLDTKKALQDAETEIAAVQKELDEQERAATEIKDRYNKVLTWSELFEGSSLEGKKMIIWQLIDRVRIYRDYRIEIDLKVEFQQLCELWHEGVKENKSETAV